MKGIFVSTLSLLFILNISAQKMQKDWAFVAGSIGRDYVESIKEDSQGNIIVGGVFEDVLDSDPGSIQNFLTSNGRVDGFVMKFDSLGGLLWSGSIGGGGFDHVYDIVIDNSDNIYVVGSFDDTADFDLGIGQHLVDAGFGHDAFILKLDSNGNFLWVRTYGGAFGFTTALSVCEDRGFLYMVGNYDDSPQFDPNKSAPSGNTAMYVLKLDLLGNFQWVKYAQSSGAINDFCTPEFIDTDGLGNIFVGGNYKGEVDFDFDTSSFHVLNSFGDANIFLEKMDSSGNFLWVKEIKGEEQELKDAAIGPMGEVVMTGNIGNDTPDTDFDPDPGNVVKGPRCLFHCGDFYPFVVKWSNQGTFEWLGVFQATYHESEGLSIDIDQNGNVYSTGVYEQSIDLDPNDTTRVLFGELNSGDVYISKLTNNGEFTWAGTVGNIFLRDEGRALICSQSGKVLVGGSFQSGPDMNPGPFKDTTWIIGSDREDLFVLRLKDCTSVFSVDTVFACDTITWVNGIEYPNSTSINSDTLYAFTGCDSIVTLDFRWEPIDTMTTQSGSTLISADSIGPYQWFDCSTNMAINGAVSQTFSATVNGDYFLVIERHGCSDTSACFNVSGVGSKLNQRSSGIAVYPNPADDNLSIDLGQEMDAVIRILDTQGRVVLNLNSSNDRIVDVDLNLRIGYYIVWIESKEFRESFELVIK